MKPLVACVVAGGIISAFGVEVRCGSHVARFDEAKQGALVSLVTRGGVEFNASPVGLFTVAARQVGALTNEIHVSAKDAKTFRCETLADGVRFIYSGFGERPVENVTCTIRGTDADKRLRWRIAAEPKTGWAITEMTYPQLRLATQIGESGEDDAILTGASFTTGLVCNPAKSKFLVDARQPGYLAVQMMCYFDPKALLLFACEDGAGEAKRLHGWYSVKKGLDMRWYRYGWDTKCAELPYDIVTATLDDPKGALTWYDGADLYKEWAVKQRWCKTPWKFRTDIPDWLRGQAAYADMGSDWRWWIDRSGLLVKWSRDYFHKLLPKAKIAVHFDGWEHNGVYNMTDYFPLYPSDEEYTKFATGAYKYGFLAFPWPSGTRRSDAFDKQPDGTFAVDERAAFERNFLPHACLQPDGTRALCGCGWLRGGKVSYMCPGDKWTRDWFANDICGQLAVRGTPCVSGDQNIGGAAAPCWSLTHGHTPGSGLWMTDAARAMAVQSLAVLRSHFPEAAFCYEEPNEHVNDTVTFNNVREAYKPNVVWTGLFNYLYHEYAPIFPLGGQGIYGQAYQMAVGLMPRVRGRQGDINHTELILPNGSFEQVAQSGAASGWSNGPRERPNGLDTAEHHSGTHAMRIERPLGTNRWDHVATNLAHEDSAFAPGRKYRFTAWTKVEKGSFRIDIGVFGEVGSLAWTRVSSGKPGEGWRQTSAELTYPTGNVSMVRLMVNAAPGTRGWLDDVKFERIRDDGTAVEVCYEGSRERDAWQKRTVELWGEEGRPWLAYGRRVKPPRIDCAEISYFNRRVQAVCVGAYVSQEGEKALVFANGTRENQKVAWDEAGVRRELSLTPREIRIVRCAK